ncbi:MAG: peptide ABC transporter substrate-binding protein [Methylophaga sp.]|nr:ABC transporter substrate-binding protein [Gammaproteobacteria bacterium]PHS69163.1 MAG: peptide ABC transporter substrate-binding protein [Methylophaga sp.]
MRQLLRWCLLLLLTLTGCDSTMLNSPYTQTNEAESILYASFSLRPKHLDPARSYSANETSFTGQIYEPPLQYHYLKRPYSLIELTATKLPTVQYFNQQGERLAEDVETSRVAYSIYEISIQPNILYQPHPAFARNEQGEFVYHQLNQQQLSTVKTLADFEQTETRELVAADYVYQIKRLAHPEIHSPILGVMGEYIVGLADYSKKLQALKQQGQIIDLNTLDIDGVTVVDSHTYQIKVHGKYPQLRYWLAMPFFAPIPWEADDFYRQEGLIKKNITMDWYPVGTGPYQLIKNDPNSKMVLIRNPNYHGETYPVEGEKADLANGMLEDAGKPLPFIDKIVFTLEKENTSYWNKFLQGYYDVSGISSDSFDQAVQVSNAGDFGLSDAMKQKGIDLKTAIGTSIYYIGFNMQDPVVGGYTEQAKNLRQAISIAVDYEEFISIFLNGRGIASQGPVAPGIFGYISGQEGINQSVYQWEAGEAKRRSILSAQALLVQAGYPQGRHQQTGEPLVLYFDVPASGPDAKAQFDWLRKQFQKLNIQLVVRSTDYNRFQDKMSSGQTQMFQWGWGADYPDPENFLFLLYGPNGKVASGGQNTANYDNVEFDRLFEKMRVMPNNDERQQIIKQMTSIVTEDAPWVWGYHPKQFSLYHAWNKNVKPNLMANNTLKYRRVDARQRYQLQQQWNRPIMWPMMLVLGLIILLLLPAWYVYSQKMHTKKQL